MEELQLNYHGNACIVGVGFIYLDISTGKVDEISHETNLQRKDKRKNEISPHIDILGIALS